MATHDKRGANLPPPTIDARVQLLRIREAGEVLRVTDSTIRRWIAAGDLQSVKIGAANRVTYSSVLDLITRGER